MMKAYSKLLFSTAIIGSLLGGCKGKDGDPGPAGPAGPAGTPGIPGTAGTSGQNLTGNLFGFVSPIDEFGVATTNKAGVTVTLEGVTPAATATTDANGRYEFQSLRNGTYNLSFARTGLATLRRLGVGHVGGDQPTFLGTNTLTATSATTISTISVVSTTSTSLTLNIPLANPNATAGTLLRGAIFVSSTANPTSTTATLYTTVSTSVNYATVVLTKATLNSLGFASGSPAYVVAYGAPTSLLSYADPATGRPVYLGLGTASNSMAFIVP